MVSNPNNLTIDEVADEVINWILGVDEETRKKSGPSELPPVVGIEIPFLAPGKQGLRSVRSQIELIGIVKYALEKEGFEFIEVAPSQAKKAITGKGNVGKDVVVKKSEEAYGGIKVATKREREAVADAIGVAEAAHILSGQGDSEI